MNRSWLFVARMVFLVFRREAFVPGRIFCLGLVLIATGAMAESPAVPKSKAVGEVSGRTMGTTWKVRYTTHPSLSTPAQLRSHVQEELDRIEAIFSLYRQDSELSRWNRGSTTAAVAVSPTFAEILQRGLQLARWTDGAFDPTVEPLSRVWRLREADADWRPPTPRDLTAARSLVNYQQIRVTQSPPAIAKGAPRMELDLNALVEGYALDQMHRCLKEQGVCSGLLELGGEFRALGSKPDGSSWRIALEDPRRLPQTLGVVHLNTGALSTSGTYRQWRDDQGRRYSHLLDARSGEPVTHSTISVTVWADDALTADGWATALLILGREEGQKLAEQHGLSVLFVETDSPHDQPTTVGMFWKDHLRTSDSAAK